MVSIPSTAGIVTLESGDRMNRLEFHRRYELSGVSAPS